MRTHYYQVNVSDQLRMVNSFDQARLIRQNQIFAANGIGPNGESLLSPSTNTILSDVQVCHSTRKPLLICNPHGRAPALRLLCRVFLFFKLYHFLHMESLAPSFLFSLLSNPLWYLH